MIELLFRFADDYILVVVKGNSIMFGNTTYGSKLCTIEGLKLSKPGVLKEFPDLEGCDDWKIQAIERFKEKIRNMPTEKQRSDYIIEDLRLHGYKPLYRKIQGFRKEVIS